MGKQEDFVLRALEERDVRFVRLWFTDVLGFLKSVAVAPAELEGAFAEGIGFDGSAIEGFTRVQESDMLAKPDPATFQVLPWREADGAPGTARMFCDITMPDGSPSYADPRYVLKRALKKAADLGDSAWRELVDRHHSLVRAQIVRNRGEELDTAGDGFFATFQRAPAGLLCAWAIREQHPRRAGGDIRRRRPAGGPRTPPAEGCSG